MWEKMGSPQMHGPPACPDVVGGCRDGLGAVLLGGWCVFQRVLMC